MNIDKFIEKVRFIFRSIEISKSNDEYTFDYQDKTFKLKEIYLLDLIQRYNALNIIDEITLSDPCYYETLVEENNHAFRGILSTGDVLKIYDDSNKVHYEIGTISDMYILFLLDKIIDESNIRYLRRIYPLHIFNMRIKDTEEFMDVIRIYLKRFTTIRIVSNNSLSSNKFKEYVDALLFNIALNTGRAIIPTKYLENVFEKRESINKINSLEQLESPQRKYISDLVYYYQMGISSHDPSQKFISFYHIIEYFFNKVYYDHLVESVRNDITNPKFSVKRDTDINKLIKNIKNKIKIESEINNIKSEFEALKLTLEKYIDIDKLKDEIINEDATYIAYYANTVVPFSQGNKINFHENSVDKVFTSIAYRIYKTRNAVIHSKFDERSTRYLPFRDESQLNKEIPLIKSIAEEIIISTSDII